MTTTTTALAIGEPQPMHNANHIFNAIHSSMRQWGSSLHHNGMTFLLAFVPKGVKLYHGDARSHPISRIGWMAFDPEHAMVFARPPSKQPSHNVDSESQQVMITPAETGWLHTHATTEDLRLVYIDGTSAGKSQIGTLDLQDRVLFEDKLEPGGIAQEEWNGRVDGVIRMAAGFEIILCNPEQKLDTVNIARVTLPIRDPAKKSGKPSDLLRTVTSRYHGIGGDRVIVNYDAFVTAYDYGLDLFHGGSKHPRLAHLPTLSLAPIRDDLTALVMNHDPTTRVINWQGVVDMMVEKYGRILRSLVSAHHDDQAARLEFIMETAECILSPFVDRDNRDYYAEIDRSVYTVSSRICSSLMAVMEAKEYGIVTTILQDLMHYLDWSIWKECSGCQDDEFCAVPIWPQGSQEDYDHPRCQKYDSAFQGDNDYWGPVWR
ncbi:uncharacterized protein BO87DRAFT_440958 [Aspergillus neoniger CBS 115656]|uniref:Uncharacterized protein n=1 Tax=Aspergillus neoniger (strain CBS 115656) TaxID=1448310 RepID=A0A318YCW0_ASPNB|nr:hypothetical protein BO87DRAFT_440958 [Aspergillus neoniger CBS 115656]PYH32216.1 hypothetical protein BO87DRAFT_440958 [Aspergillus neoniger CBS 115656]